MRTRLIFVGLSVVLLGLVAWAAFKDSSARTYITIQEQYQKDYPQSDFNVQVQQLFPKPMHGHPAEFLVDGRQQTHDLDLGIIAQEV